MNRSSSCFPFDINLDAEGGTPAQQHFDNAFTLACQLAQTDTSRDEMGLMTVHLTVYQTGTPKVQLVSHPFLSQIQWTDGVAARPHAAFSLYKSGLTPPVRVSQSQSVTIGCSQPYFDRLAPLSVFPDRRWGAPKVP